MIGVSRDFLKRRKKLKNLDAVRLSTCDYQKTLLKEPKDKPQSKGKNTCHMPIQQKIHT